MKKFGSMFRGFLPRAVAILLALPRVSSALLAEGFLDDHQRTNGADTLSALGPLKEKAAASTLLIGTERDKPQLSATILSASGYLLTKATETPSPKSLKVWFPDGTSEEARLVKRDDKLDVALLKVERDGLREISWAESKSLRPGQWLCALTGHGGQIRLGVMSASRRAISNSGAFMGVRFAHTEAGDRGVEIEEVAADGPAEQAGLRADDVIMEMNGLKVNDTGAVKRIMTPLRPGDVVKIKYKREGRDGQCEVRLASKKQVMMNWGGEDFGNHGTSSRTDNYSEVIQHDMPLDPSDMGGVVYDVQGRAVALNIARVDRVTNYALPVELFLPEVTKWMRDDREKKRK